MSRRVRGTVVCSIDNVGSTVDTIITDYSTRAIQHGKNAVREVSKESASVVRRSGTYTNRRNKYRPSITYKVEESVHDAQGIVYASGHEYSLTHLLENGHKLWQAPNVRTRAFEHWYEGERYAQSALLARIVDKLNGG